MRLDLTATLGLLGVAASVTLHGSDPDARRPHYELVDGSIETLWQRPLTDTVKGVFFAAHGCSHQATDFFTDTGADGWELDGCKTSTFGRCLGLPEERQVVRSARERGYLVVAVSGTGSRRCWNSKKDVPRVEKAIRHILEKEGLDHATPVIGFGASSGGSFMGPLATSSLAKQLMCVAPQISNADLKQAQVPAIFSHMARDTGTTGRVKATMKDLEARGVRVSRVEAQPSPVDVNLFSKAMSAVEAEKVVKALKEAGYLDADGRLLLDPRRSKWRKALASAAPARDSLVGDESPISELLNVAWARHEIMGSHMTAILDFCEHP